MSAVVRLTISSSSSSSGIIDEGVEHEAVQLRLRQRVGAFLLDGVLRGQHEKGSVSRCRLPPTVTWCSCIASSRAACVLGGVRLISSARITLAKIGPRRNCNSRRPGSLSSWMTSVPVMSEGIRSGVNWMRLNSSDSAVGQRADHQRLGQPRHAHQQAMAAGEHGDQQLLDHLLLADDHPAQLLGDQPVGLVEFLHGLDVFVLEHGQ